LSIDTEALKARTDIVLVVSAFVALKKLGAEYRGRCPFHSPDNNPSFYVVPAKGLYHCFSCGASGDIINFLQEKEGIDFKSACERLNGGAVEWKPITPIKQEASAKQPERITSKPPPDAPTPKMSIHKLGEPSRIWPYRDTDGGILGYVARYETPEGKQIRVWSWGSRADNAPQWACGHWNSPRPLYRRDVLAQRTDAPVLVVEGEKAADAAQTLLPAYTVTTWPGGAQSWHKADWTLLLGRKVLLWPDNDAAGIECMDKLAALLADEHGLGCNVRIIDPNRMADGFDAADWTGTTEELIAWAKPRAKDYVSPAPAADAPVDGAPVTAAPTAGLSEETPPIEAYSEEPAAQTKKRRPRLAAVDGNAVPAPNPDDVPLPVAMSEDAIADAFAEEHTQDWRYVAQWGKWLHWDGDGWRRDQKELVDRLAVEMCRRAVTWPEGRALEVSTRRRICQRKTAGAVRDTARNDRRISASPDGWDADVLLVGIPGGVFDVSSGKVIEAAREQYITRCTAVAPAAGDPTRWLGHLKRMMDGDEAMVNFLHLFAGYCATGDVSEQCFLFLYGMGQTGKGTYLLTLCELLGSYAAQSSASTFMSADREKHSSEIARLAGCRLVVIDETDGTQRWNEERIKRMTGGGRITAARKYHDEEDIPVTWKLAFAGNHKPALRGVGKEMERRLRLVKCNASIPDEDVDRKFRENMLAQEGPQILEWILQGAVRWHESGLPLPEPISDATRDYLESEDVLGDWLGECTEQCGDTKRSDAYRNYAEWAEKAGGRAWSNRAWWAGMEDRGYKARKTNGIWHAIGLTLKNPPSYDPQPGRYPDG
jgi:P4 family phage/plasmid primase-like protien